MTTARPAFPAAAAQWLRTPLPWLDGLTWRSVAMTIGAATVLALPSESVWQQWADFSPAFFGVLSPFGAWVGTSWPWFALSVVSGILVLVVAVVLSHALPERLLPVALATAVLLGAAAMSGLAGFGGGSPAALLTAREFRVGLITWGYAAATWYAVERAQLLPWRGVAVVFAFCMLNYARGVAHWTDENDERLLTSISNSLFYMTGAMVIVISVIATAHRFAEPGRRQYTALAAAVLLSSAIGYTVQLAIMSGGQMIQKTPFGDAAFAISLARGMLRYGVLATLFAAAYAYYRNQLRAQAQLRAEQVRDAQLDTQIDEARLQVMQAQIEPHFLFNTLANVKRLYDTEPAVADTMLENLMRYFAIALPHLRGAESTLERELNLATAYLDIHKIRMGRRLAVEIDVPRHLREASIPPMMLLTVVENAIKHGINPLPEGGVIRISAREQQGRLEIRVVDSGRGFAKSSGAGTGLANTRARLAAMYETRGQLHLSAVSPRGVAATLSLPLARAGAVQP